MGVRLKTVLNMLGIKGTMLPDGRFQTADGQIVGLGDLTGDGLGGSGMGAGLTGVFGANGVMGGSPNVHHLPDTRLKKMLDMERRNVSILKAKLSAKKEEVAKLKAQAKKDNADLRGFMLSQRKLADDNQSVLMDKVGLHSIARQCAAGMVSAVVLTCVFWYQQRALQAQLLKKDDVTQEMVASCVMVASPQVPLPLTSHRCCSCKKSSTTTRRWWSTSNT